MLKIISISKKELFIIIAILFITLNSNAQGYGLYGIQYKSTIENVYGDPTIIFNEDTINVEYDFSNISIGGYTTEELYVSIKVQQLNGHKAGEGDKWKADWFAAPKKIYEPQFEELLNTRCNKIKLTFGNYPKSKYTLLVVTKLIDPGLNEGYNHKPAFIDVQCIIVESDNPAKVIAQYDISHVTGRDAEGANNVPTLRIGESFAKAGKMLGKELYELKKSTIQDYK